jgi:hypothetical protein
MLLDSRTLIIAQHAFEIRQKKIVRMLSAAGRFCFFQLFKPLLSSSSNFLRNFSKQRRV